MAPCYQISGKYFGREEAFPLSHLLWYLRADSAMFVPVSNKYLHKTTQFLDPLNFPVWHLNLTLLTFPSVRCTVC